MKIRIFLLITLSFLSACLQAQVPTTSLSMFTLHPKKIKTAIYNNQQAYKKLKPSTNKTINHLNKSMQQLSNAMTLRLTKIPHGTALTTSIDIGRFFKMVGLLKPVSEKLSSHEKIVICQRVNKLNQFLTIINRYYYHPTAAHSDAIQQFYNNNKDAFRDLFSSGTTKAKACKLN